MNLTIAPLTPDLYGEAADLWIATWSAEMPDFDFGARRDWLLGHLADLTAKGIVVDAASDPEDRLLGFITLDRSNGYIDQLAVSVAAKGNGVAAALIDHARALSPQKLDLKVNEANPRAIAFYLKHGFVTVARGFSERTGLPVLEMRWTPGGALQQAAQQQ